MANGQKVGERVVWEIEKVNRWDIPSYTYAGKSTEPPSHCLAALEIKGPGRQLLALGGGTVGKSTSALLPVLNSQPPLGDPSESTVFYNLRSLQSRSIMESPKQN